MNKMEWPGDDQCYREKQSRARGEGVPGWGRFVIFSFVGQGRPHCEGDLKGDIKETMQTFGEREFQAEVISSSKS